MKKMGNRVLYIIALVPFIIGLIIGSFFDEQIAAAVMITPTENIYGLFFSCCSALLPYGFLSFIGGYALRYGITEKDKVKKVFCFICFVVATTVSIIFTQEKFTSINGLGMFEGVKDYAILFILGCTIIVGVCSFLGFRTCMKNRNARALVSCLVLVGFSFISIVAFGQVTKAIMRRPRFRTIGIIPGSTFKNWWEPFSVEYAQIKEAYGSTIENISEEFKSFPSGHSGEAACAIFMIPYLGFFNDWCKRHRPLLAGLGVIFTYLVCFSRMTMGAHYLTDICMGSLATIICGIVATEINLKVLNHYGRKKLVEEKIEVE